MRPARDSVRRQIVAGRLPRPSYVLDDGTEMVPADFFELADEAGAPQRVRADFKRRFVDAGGDPAGAEEEWLFYLSGVYGICLREVSPETIVRKSALMEGIGRLLDQPRPDEAEWRHDLRDQVDELDALEREFSPDFDPGDRFEQPPSRDRLVAATRERFPDVFAREQTPP